MQQRGVCVSLRRIPAALLVAVWAWSPAAAAASQSPSWVNVTAGATGRRTGAVLVYAPDSDRMLLVGPVTGAPFIQAFDPVAHVWSPVCQDAPAKRFHPYYQAAYDPQTKTLFCLSGSNVLSCFDLREKTWRVLPPARELDGMSWHTMACDPHGRRLVVVGADKRAGNIGWIRTVLFDIPKGTWRRLEPTDEKTTRVHREFGALHEAVTDLAGNIRLVWYRSPTGNGTESERKDLISRCEAIETQPQAQRFTASFSMIRSLLGRERTLEALKAARRLKRTIEEAAEASYPVPCSRRNSPVAYDAASGVFVLFGGDHENYLMNDTWVLDPGAGIWKRMEPDVAPAPRAGHALFPLPKHGGVVLYGGYVQRTSTDYGAASYWPAQPTELWRYDPSTNRWDALGSWPHPEKNETDKLPPVEHFYGYAAQYYSPPAIAADKEDRIVLAAHPGNVWFLRWKDFPAGTWLLRPGRVRPDAELRLKLGRAPNLRQDRGGAFVAAYCEVADPHEDLGLDRLPENRWIRLPKPPRNPCFGCRQRDWGTAVWDSDRDQVLLWGGGHCVRSASTVVHWSPASGRIVEGFDADEPYGANGGGGFEGRRGGRWVSYSTGWMYDAQRRLAYVFTIFGEAWALKVNPATAHLIEHLKE